MADATFSDSIEQNIELLESTFHSLGAEGFAQAKFAAKVIEQTFMKLRQDYPANRGISVGAAYAVHKIAQRIVEASNADKPESRILLPN